MLFSGSVTWTRKPAENNHVRASPTPTLSLVASQMFYLKNTIKFTFCSPPACRYRSRYSEHRVKLFSYEAAAGHVTSPSQPYSGHVKDQLTIEDHPKPPKGPAVRKDED